MICGANYFVVVSWVLDVAVRCTNDDSLVHQVTDGGVAIDDGSSDDDSSADSGSSIDTLSSDDNEVFLQELATIQALQLHVLRSQQKIRRIVTTICKLGMYHFDKYIDKAPYRVLVQSGYEWTVRTLGIRTQCYMFRMHRDVFDSLHNVLVERYGLKSTKK